MEKVKIWDRGRFIELGHVIESFANNTNVEFSTDDGQTWAGPYTVGSGGRAEEALVLAWWQAKRDPNTLSFKPAALRRYEADASEQDEIAARMLRLLVAAELRQVEFTPQTLAMSSRATPHLAEFCIDFLAGVYLEVLQDELDHPNFWTAPVRLKGLWVHALAAADKLDRLHEATKATAF
jgi:hypothetical protein